MNTPNNDRLVAGVFPNPSSAEGAYNAASEGGYANKDGDVVMYDETRRTHFVGAGAETELDNNAVEGARIGGAIGGTIGDIAAAIAAVGTNLAVPGFGLVIAGCLPAARAGLGTSAASGGRVGALIGWNIPEERVKHYEPCIRDDGILFGVRA